VGLKRHRLTPSAWAIVLAGGDGIRLKDLTRKINGDSRLKQFSKYGDRSLLAHSVRLPLTRPARDYTPRLIPHNKQAIVCITG
jgi:mannose-1-phosphate guanylyltransferase